MNIKIFNTAIKEVLGLLRFAFDRRTDQEIFQDTYIKTSDDVLKMHNAVMKTTKTRKPVKVLFSNGKEVIITGRNAL